MGVGIPVSVGIVEILRLKSFQDETAPSIAELFLGSQVDFERITIAFRIDFSINTQTKN